MRILLSRLLTSGGVAAALLAQLTTVTDARAQNAACSELPNPVYVAGSSAVKPFLAAVAGALAKLDEPMTVVYQSGGSCAGVQLMSTDPAGTITGTAAIWDESGVEGACDLSIAGDGVDVAFSDVYADSCGGDPLPENVADFTGPIQSMAFVVPANSTENVISAEAAYLTCGLGDDGDTAWPAAGLQRRSATSGTQQMISAAIGVPAAKWVGTENAKSDGVLAALQTASASQDTANQTLGILAMDFVDKHRDAVKALAYQHYKQNAGFWPDSTVTSFDKQNVRDGHYMIWGPLHMLAVVDGSGDVVNPAAAAIIGLLSGEVEATDLDLIAIEAKGGVVPSCAMKVTRSSEVGPLSSFAPERSCECKFVSEATGESSDSCQACDTDADCSDAAPNCNYGYCEVQ